MTRWAALSPSSPATVAAPTGEAFGDADPQAALQEHLAKHNVHNGRALGVALSGGGDSVALLHAAVRWARENGRTLHAATVDHGLRPDAAEEARVAAAEAARLGAIHETLHWTGAKPTSGLQAAARRARYRLLTDWAQRRGLACVLLGHNRDDVAETHLMRAARGDDAYGLAAMADRFHTAVGRGEAQVFLRPLLHHGRADLRIYATALGARWIDDPSNADPRYERVRVRRAVTDAGAAQAAACAFRLRDDRMRLERDLLDWVKAHAPISPYGHIALDLDAFRRLEPPMATRALAWCLCAVSGTPTPPRGDALRRRVASLRAGHGAAPLHGCIFTAFGRGLALVRERRAMQARLARADDGPLWDGRFLLLEGSRAAPIGEDEARRTAKSLGAPRRAVATGPAPGGAPFFRGDVPTARFVSDYPHSGAVRRF